MIDGKNFFDQPINSNFKTYENIRNIATGQGDDYTTSCLLDYSYFKDHYRMIAIDLSKQQVLDADPRGTQQISFTANLYNNVLYYWRSKRDCFWIFTRNCESFVNAISSDNSNFINIRLHNTTV